MRTTRLLFLSFSSVLGFLVITLRNLLPPPVLEGLLVAAGVGASSALVVFLFSNHKPRLAKSAPAACLPL